LERPAIAAIVPVHGREKPLSRVVRSLLASEGVAVDVVLVDATPDAGPIPLDEDVSDQVRTLAEPEPVGFARAINDGVRGTRAPHVLFANDDLLVSPTYMRELVDALHRHPRAALVGGKILRLDLDTDRPTRTIDTAGIAIRRSRRAVNRGEGTRDDGRFDEETEVFGVSGAGLLARRDALDEGTLGAGALDESFFMYKEDVDLAWRLRLLGWECWYVPSAVGYHARTSRSGGGSYLRHPRGFARIERTKPEYVRLHSMKNQWLMLVKNEHARDLFRDAPWILGRESVVFLHNAVLAPRTLRAIPLFFRALPRALADRRALRLRTPPGARQLRRWFT
jgi:GT2 family glycosyltransferase